MIIRNNISYLNTYNNLQFNNKKLANTIENLSSGLRINSASNDAAGFSMSQKMKMQLKGFHKALNNVQNGISFLQTRESALGEVTSILQRMRELSVKASNDTYSGFDRNNMQSELIELKDEVNRILKNTTFNKKSIFNNIVNEPLESIETLSVEIGEDLLEGTKGIARGIVDLHGKKGTRYAPEFIFKTETNTDELNKKILSLKASQGETHAIINENSIEVYINKDPYHIEDLITDIEVEINKVSETNIYIENKEELVNEYSETKNKDIELVSITPNSLSQSLTFSSGIKDRLMTSFKYTLPELKLGDKIEINGLTIEVVDKVTNKYQIDVKENNIAQIVNIFSDDLNYKVSGEVNVLSFIKKDGSVPNLDSVRIISKEKTNGDKGDYKDSNELNSYKMSLQIGANSEDVMSLNLSNISTESLGIDQSLSILDVSNAQKAIDIIDNSISLITRERSKTGIYQNRLEFAINNIRSNDENLYSAYSRIVDADMAKELMVLTKYKILSDISRTMLNKNNISRQSVLKLLMNI